MIGAVGGYLAANLFAIILGFALLLVYRKRRMAGGGGA